MSLSRETMTELMALADGELEGEARERVQRLASESDEARQLVDAMRAPGLGLWLAETMDQRTGVADGIADAVMAKLEAAESERKREAAGGAVVRLADARARRSGVTGGQLAVLGGALALAATILLYMRSTQETGAPVPVASVTVPSAALSSIEVRSAAPPKVLAQGTHGQGVEVDEIDSPAHDVTVFEIPVAGMAAAAAASGGGPSSVVIMIEDEPGSR